MALRTGLEPMTLRLTAACSTNWANEACMWEYHHPLWQRPLCAAFLTSGKIKHLEFICPKLCTQSYSCVCLERLVSCIQYILAVHSTPFNHYSFVYQTDTESAGNRLKIAQKVSSGFVTPRLWPMGWRFFHLSFKLLITHHWILKRIVLSPFYTSCTLNALLPSIFSSLKI